MAKVIAQSIPTEYCFPNDSEIVKIEYALGRLAIHLHGFKSGPHLIIEFEYVTGFRVLDERDLLEFWPTCSTPNGWLFEITASGWLSQEANRSCLLLDMQPNLKEYLVTGLDDCVSVLSEIGPLIREDVSQRSLT